jgi:hypothetical protein
MYRKILYDDLVFPPEVSPAARAVLTKARIAPPWCNSRMADTPAYAGQHPHPP